MVSPDGESDLRGVHGEDHGAAGASGSKTPPTASRLDTAGDSDASTNPAPPPAPTPQNDAHDATPPPTLPDFDLLKRIDGGGFGDVWIARNQHTGHCVAVKILRAHADVELAALRIVQQAVSNHPNLTPIEHVGRTQEHLYMVMPLADCASSDSPAVDVNNYRALTLNRHAAKATSLPAAEIAAIGADLASALDQLHRNGIVHGDVKPTNVLRIGGAWRLGDYSLSVFTDERRRTGKSRDFSPPDGAVGPGADLYALGVTLFRMTGRPEGDLKALLGDGRIEAEEQDWPLLREIRSLCSACRPGGSFSAEEASERLSTIAQCAPKTSTAARLGVQVRRAAPNAARACVVAAAATLIGAVLTTPFLFQWTSIHDWHWRWLRSIGAASVAANLERLDDVAIIAMRDDTPFAALGEEAGLHDVNPANLQSLRRLHGEMCRRLAEASPRTVVWDITFRSESPFDEDFSAGIRTLMDRGVGVVTTSYGWRDFSTDSPPISPVIWETGVRWGSNHVVLDPSGALWVPLVVEREDGAGLPSIVLSAFASWRRPDAWFDVKIDHSAREAVVTYWRPVRSRPDRREVVGTEDRVPLTIVQRYDRPVGRGRDPGILETDMLGMQQVDIAPETALDAATLNYEDAFRASSDDLRHALRDKVVVIGDFRTSARDYHTIPDRGVVYGPHILASATELVLARAAPRIVRPFTHWLLVFIAAFVVAVSVKVSFSPCSRPTLRGYMLCAVSIIGVWSLLFLFSIFRFRFMSELFTPYPGSLAAAFAAMISVTMVLASRPRIRPALNLKGKN